LAADVYIREGETQESLLKRFQRTVQMSGILREVKANRYFLSKGETARLKAKKAARRRRRYNR
jgi:ribosomal protein S21